MKKSRIYKVIFSTLLLLSVQNILWSCTCHPYEPVFCRAVSESENIIRAVVTDHPEEYLMEVSILENLNKEILETSVLVYGQDGFTCGENLSQFNISDTLILAIEYRQINGNDFYWYLEGLCGLHFLRYQNEIISGQIRDDLTTQPIEDFKQDLFECLELTVPLSEVINLENNLSIYPNPVSQELKISNENSVLLEVEFFTLKGKLSHRIQNINSNAVIFNTNQLSQGVYFIKTKTAKGTFVRRIIKT